MRTLLVAAAFLLCGVPPVLGQETPHEEYGIVLGAAVLPDGRLVYTTWGRSQPTLVDADTAFGVGGTYQGPGGFRSANFMGFVGDSLWIVDHGYYRVSMVDPATLEVLSARPFSVPYPPQGFAGGDTYFVLLGPEANEDIGGGRWLSIYQTGAPAQRLAVVKRATRILMTGGGGQIGVPRPMVSDDILMTYGTQMVVVDRDEPGVVSITAYGDGGAKWSHELEMPAVKLSNDDWDAALDATFYASQGAFDQVGMSLALFKRAVNSSMDKPEYLPAVQHATVAATGEVWLASAEPGEWRIVDRSGVVRTLRLPPNEVVIAARGPVFWTKRTDTNAVTTFRKRMR